MAADLTESFRPTLLVGVGGTGIKIAEKVFARTAASGAALRDRLDIIGLDTDENELRAMRRLERRQTIQISTQDRVDALLDKNPDVEADWFGPRQRLPYEILKMSLVDGAAQIRLLTRLAFTHMTRSNEVQQRLGDAIARIAAANSRTPFKGTLNIMLCGSLAGATGSGLFLPVALLVEQLCRERSITAEVRGLFLLPDIYVRGGSMPSGQIENVHANSYAALKELNAINLLAGERGAYTSFRFAYVPGARIEPGMFPFKAVTLIDYENTRGSNLGRTLDNYLEMASRAAYLLLFTPVGQQEAAGSTNDQRARAIAAAAGTTNLYSGVGVSAIVYPAHEIADYLTLRLALDNLEGDWLRLDDAFFERQRRFEEQRAAGNLSARRPEQGPAFLEDLEQLGRKDRIPFFAEIHANLHPRIRNAQDQTEETVPRFEAYVAALEAEVIDRFWSRERPREARERRPIDAAHLKNMTSLVDVVRSLEMTMDDDLREIDAVLVNGPEDDFANILTTGDSLAEGEWAPHHLQYHIIRGGPHLVEVRAFLYGLARTIAARRASLDPTAERRRLFTQANVFDAERGGTPAERGTPKTLEQARDVAGRNLFARLLKGGADEFQDSYTAYYNASLGQLRRYAEAEIRLRVLDRLATEVAGLERHFAGLFVELRTLFDRLRDKARQLENAHTSEARTTDGNVFVAADPAAKVAVWDDLRTRAAGLRLEADANRALARGVYRQYRDDRVHRRETDFGKLGDIFVTAIVETFARGTIQTKFRSNYDFGVIEAIRRDCARTGADFLPRLRALVDLVSAQSEPFLSLTDIGVGQRSMFWAIHPDVPRDIADPGAFEQLFTLNQGDRPLVEPVFSPRQLLCLHSRVLLELKHLTKLDAGRPDTRTPGGRYFEAYARMVDSLIEEDIDPTRKSPSLTPHLDHSWHRPGVLPELSTDLGRAQQAQTYRAFAIALAQGLIEERDHYGARKAEFSTLGRTVQAGAVADLADSHDLWDIVRAFEARSALARPALRYWDDVIRRLQSGQSVTPDPHRTLTDPALIERILRLSVPRDDGEARDRRTQAILTGWIEALDDVERVVARTLEEPGRRARREETLLRVRAAAMAALTGSGVRPETLAGLDRVFSRAIEVFETARAPSRPGS